MAVDGYDYTRAPGRQRRKLLGHASVRVPLERGTVSRAITYRNPKATDEQTRAALARVGLDRVLEEFPRGEDTRLKNGGQPLTGSQVARLKLGRALLDNPPLLVLDGIDADLDGEGLRLLRAELEAYPGVVLFTSQNPGRIAPGHRVWTVDAP
jgi:ABC-type multidrug transport system fused ATPase/permease subunit